MQLTYFKADHISQSSVTTCSVRDAISCVHLVANLLQNMSVKEFWK